MKWLALSLVLVSQTLMAQAAPASARERELEARLREVTAEAEYLWKYVMSGPDNPDVRALDRAFALYDKRRPRRK